MKHFLLISILFISCNKSTPTEPKTVLTLSGTWASSAPTLLLNFTVGSKINDTLFNASGKFDQTYKGTGVIVFKTPSVFLTIREDSVNNSFNPNHAAYYYGIILDNNNIRGPYTSSQISMFRDSLVVTKQ